MPVFGDTSDILLLNSVGGVPLSNQVAVQGGPNFPYFEGGWSSGRQQAESLYKKALEADPAGGSPIAIYSAMGPDALPFTNATVESMLGQLDAIQIPKRDLRLFDREIRKTHPGFVGLESPEVLDQLTGKGAFQGASARMRKDVVEEMSKANWRNLGFPVYGDVYNAIVRRELANQPVGSSGYSMFEVDTVAGLSPETVHGTYNTRIPGTYAGGFESPLPADIMFPKSWAALGSARTKHGELLTDPQKIGSLRMSNPVELADQQWVDTVSEALERGTPYEPTVPHTSRFPDRSAPFGRGRTYRATHEQVPGAVTGHLEGITRLPEQAREDYSRVADWLDEYGRDQLYASQLLPVEQSAFGRGAYEGPHGTEFNPLTVGQPVTADTPRVEATEAARAYIDAQAAGAAHRILPHSQSSPNERVDLSVDVRGLDMTSEQFARLDKLAKDNDFFAIDSGDQVVLNSYPWNEDRPAKMLEDSAFGRSEMLDLQRQVREILPGARLRREKLDVVYEDYEELYKDVAAGTEDPGAVTRRMFERVDARPDVRDAIEPDLKDKARRNLDRDAQYSKDNELSLNPAITRALTIFAEGGFDALRKALDGGIVLPAVAATILAPSFLDSDQDI
tara:strand:+ start:17 stop:1879 length:1863 start_codon:yes stop_codon:yes gene_type:complete